MQNQFLHPSDPLLYKKAKLVKKSDLKQKWFLDIVAAMRDVANIEQHHDRKRSVMIGLAAPQIGYPHKIAFANIAANTERTHTETRNVFMVNPRILSRGGRKLRYQEGCFSARLTECEVRGIVARNQTIEVEYMTLEGEKIRERIVGFPAVIIQHEVDHLEGIVFVDHIHNQKDLHIVFPSEYPAYRKHWRHWHHTMNPETYRKDVSGR